MINIDECIKLSKEMKNTSDGGSASFIFGDYVLVCYSIPTKYGIARENEEKIMEAVNKKADMGVNTPRHVAIRRLTEGDTNYCYVLQERAKGQCFANYCTGVDCHDKIDKQRDVANIPQEHFNKYAADLIELFGFGLETKPKNFFYDENVGFITIDLLDDGSKKVFDKNNVADINYLFSLLNSIRGAKISCYDREASEDVKDLSKGIDYVILFKIYNAVKSNIPNFELFERRILRNFDNETIQKFKDFGIKINDLTLTEDEEKDFDEELNRIALLSIEKIKSGKYELWQIEANEIRIDLDSNLLKSSWFFHKGNKRNPNVKPEGWYEDEEYTYYDYIRTCNHDLELKCYEIFVSLLEQEYASGDNEYVIAAYKEYLNKKRTIK